MAGEQRLPCDGCALLFAPEDLDAVSGGGSLCEGCLARYLQPLPDDPLLVDCGFVDLDLAQ